MKVHVLANQLIILEETQGLAGYFTAHKITVHKTNLHLSLHYMSLQVVNRQYYADIQKWRTSV